MTKKEEIQNMIRQAYVEGMKSSLWIDMKHKNESAGRQCELTEEYLQEFIQKWDKRIDEVLMDNVNA